MTDKGESIRIIRAVKDKDNPYFQCRRDVAQNKSLSWEARGMMAYLLSKPDDWKVNAKDLQQGCGKHKVYSILDELIKAKYMSREVSKDDDGKFTGYTYYVYEEPQTDEPTVEPIKTPLAESNRVPQNGIRKNGIPKTGTHTYKEIKQNTESTNTIGSLKSKNQLDTQQTDEPTVEPIETPLAESVETEKPKRQRSEKQQQLDAMIEALAAVQHLVRDTIPNKRWGSLRAAGRELLDKGVSIDELPALYRYVTVTLGYKNSTEHAMVSKLPEFRRDVTSKQKMVVTTITSAQRAEQAMYQQQEEAA